MIKRKHNYRVMIYTLTSRSTIYRFVYIFKQNIVYLSNLPQTHFLNLVCTKNSHVLNLRVHDRITYPG